MIEAVIFDWGGTLAPWVEMDHLAGWLAYAEVLYPGEPEVAARVAAALLVAEEGRWALARDEHRAFRLEQVVADASAALEAAGGPAPPYRQDALAAFHRVWTAASHTRPEVAPMLGALRARGTTLGVLSSTGWPRDWHEGFLRRDGVFELFDGCVWSSDLAWTKPHPEAFAAAMRAIRVSDPARCVYVGDRLYDDVYGAKQVGMRAVYIPHSVLPAHQLVAVDVQPDAVLDDLALLPELIADW